MQGRGQKAAQPIPGFGVVCALGDGEGGRKCPGRLLEHRLQTQPLPSALHFFFPTLLGSYRQIKNRRAIQALLSFTQGGFTLQELFSPHGFRTRNDFSRTTNWSILALSEINPLPEPQFAINKTSNSGSHLKGT